MAKINIRRYLLPSIITNIYYMLRFKCYISLKSEIQPSRNIMIGEKTRISSFVVMKVNEGKLRIGNNCTINSFCFILAGEKGVDIGNDVLIGSNSSIHALNYDYKSREKHIVDQGTISKGITIEDDVWIGANTLIVDGVTISKGAVVGGGSVVTKDIPPYSLAVGVPAKVIKERV